MKLNKKPVALLLAAVMAASMTACGGGGSSTPATTAAAGGGAAETNGASSSGGKAEFEINIGHINDERDSWHQGALKFKEYVEEKSGGRIAVNVYQQPAGHRGGYDPVHPDPGRMRYHFYR